MMELEKRKFKRIGFAAAVKLVDENQEYSCELVDISLKGALIEIPGGWSGEKNNHYDLVFKLDDRAVIKTEVEVVYLRRQYAGMFFKKVDIDSFTHLRKLIELNIGDSELVDREIFEFWVGS